MDVSAQCVQASQNRFAKESTVSFHLNDGKSLEFAADNSVDFVFSMDSLIHADEIALKAYIMEIHRILTKDGVAFLHHSNLGSIHPF